MKKAMPVVATMIAAVAGYALYPYGTANLLREALATKDHAELDRLIDLPSVRDGLKRDLPAIARSEMIRDTDGWLAQLSAEVALELSPALPARRITVRLTIDGLTRLARRLIPPGASRKRWPDDDPVPAHGFNAGAIRPATFSIVRPTT